MMKKTFLFLMVFAVAGLALYADDADEKNKIPERGMFDLSAGFTYTNNPQLFGGHFEFGINLYSKYIFIQNRFLLRAGGFEAESSFDSTVLTLSEKLVVGRMAEDVLGVYIYIEGGAGFYGNAKNSFSGDTLSYSFGFGGGFELGSFGDFGGLYIEAGYLGQKMTVNFPLSGFVIQTGWRIIL